MPPKRPAVYSAPSRAGRGIINRRKVFYKNQPAGYNDKGFRANRIINYTTKGVPNRKVTNDNVQLANEVDEFDEIIFGPGSDPRYQFVLDLKKSRERDPISTRNFDGDDYKLARRRLQPLTRPWGLPNRLPTTQPPGEPLVRPVNVPGLTVKNTDSAAAINSACVLRGIPITGNKKARHALCLRWEAQFGKAPELEPSDLQLLPFYLVKEKMTKDEVDSSVDFEEGEIVLKFATNRNKISVVDYQGIEATFKKDELSKESGDPFKFGEVDLYWLNRDAA